MQVRIINPVEYKDWDRQIKKLEGSTIFHTAAWAKVLLESYGYNPVYFTVLKNEEIVGFLPVFTINSFLTGRRGVSLPFTDECRPLIDSDQIFKTVWKFVLQHGENAKWKHIELRGEHSAYRSEPCFDRFYFHQIDLNCDDAQLLRRFRDSNKRNIKKALRCGVKIRQEYSLESVEEFYRLNCFTRKKHGLPPQPLKFFIKLYDHIVSKKKGFVSLASIEDKVIAAAVFLKFHERMTYKYGASHNGYLKYRANNLLIWDAIKTAIKDGYKQFDFGRTEAANEGLLQFKRGWAAREYKRGYYRYTFENHQFVESSYRLKSSYGVLKKLPIPLLRMIGRLLYRHVG